MNSVNHADGKRVPPSVCLRVERETKVGSPDNGRRGICWETGIGKNLQQAGTELCQAQWDLD